MENIYRVLSYFVFVTFGLLVYSTQSAAQAPITVTGNVINPSCYGATNGAINLTVTGAGGGASTGTYCTPDYGSLPCQCTGTWDHINNVFTTGGSTNISSLETDCTNPGGIQYSANYVFFPTQIVTVNPGQSFGINVQCGNNTTGCSSQYAQGFRVWIDYNTDGDFADGGEDVWNSGVSGFQLFTGNITVPASTTCGAKRMRVRCIYAGVPQPDNYCGYGSHGETEEYTVQVCTPASYLWSNGATTEDINSLPSGQYTVTVTAGTQTSVVSFTVAQPSQVLTNITAAGNDTLLCPNEQTVLTASGQPSWTYTWSNGATGSSITVSQPAVYSVTVSNTNGCSATDQITVLTALAANPPVISPSDTTLVCQGGTTTLTVTPSTNIIWQPSGETSASITVSQSGDYFVTYTDASGCTGESESVTVLVVPPPVTTITPDGPTSFCQGGSVVLTSNYTAGNVWSNGSTSSSITVNSSGTYGLTVTIASCNDAAQDVTVTVNPLPTPQITPDGPLSFCEGGSVWLSSNYASGNYWSSTSTMQQILIDFTSSYTLTVTDANGCSAVAGPVDVEENPAPAAPVITPNGPTTICQGNSVMLTSSYNTGNQWSNNSATNAIAVNTSGSYAVTVTDATGCTAVSSPLSVTVNPVPTASFSVPASVCIVDEATVTYTGTGTAAATYDWNFNNAFVVSGSGSGPYSLSFPSTGTCTISLQVTEPTGCVSTIASNNILVNTNPTADFTTDIAALCAGNALVVTYNGSAPSTATYNWNFGGGTILSGSDQGPYVVQFNAPGTPAITLTVTQGSCVSEPFSLLVNVNALPNPTFGVDHSAGCDSLSVLFYPMESGASYAWNFGDGNTGTGAAPTHFYTPGIYTVSLAVVDANGCANAFTDTALIQVYSTPLAAFGSTPTLQDTLNMDEAIISFDNNSEHAISFDWSFGDGVNSTEYNPTHSYLTSGEYVVQLIATNPLGCSDTAVSETFFVLPGAITFIPNTFTPNGDGYNDIFKAYSYRFKKAYLTVYDRSGEKVFETNDIEKGWDGTMRGKQCNSGVFVYYCKILYFTGEEKEYFGDITLLR